MSLLQTINAGTRKIFFHFHDAPKWKEEEHPRAKSGQFTKGAGVHHTEKPGAAPGSVVVNPVALALKEHGYNKIKSAKGTNLYEHALSGHQVEVHAASEGQKWLTGWSHSEGGKGSGAGKLSKHLASIPHGAPSGGPPGILPELSKQMGLGTPSKKEEPDAFEKKVEQLSKYTPPPPKKTLADYPEMTFTGPGAAHLKPAIQAKPGVQHPMPKVHASMSTMGFVPTDKNATTTTYEHPDKGKVVIKNTAPKSGYNKNKVHWAYYKPGSTLITKAGSGINNGQLNQAIQIHAPSSMVAAKTGVPQPHPMPLVHTTMSEMGFTPSHSGTYSTSYTHPTKGKVIIENASTGGQYSNNVVEWTYQPPMGKPVTGSGVANGNLASTIVSQKSNWEPGTAGGGEHVTKPSWSKYENEYPLDISSGPAIHYSGSPGHPDETLIIGTGASNKGEWKLTTEEGAVYKGNGQKSLNDEFEKLHPRGAGGKFIAKSKPPQVKQDDHKTLEDNGFSYLGPAPWSQQGAAGFVAVYGKPDGSMILAKKEAGINTGTIFQPSDVLLNDHGSDAYQELQTMLGGATPVKAPIPTPSAPVAKSNISHPDPEMQKVLQSYAGLKKSGNGPDFEVTDPDTGSYIGEIFTDKDGGWALSSAMSFSGNNNSGAGAESLAKALSQVDALKHLGPSEAPSEPLKVPAHLVTGTPKYVKNYYMPQESEGEEAYKYELPNDQTLVVGQKTGSWEILDLNSNTQSEGTGQEELNYELNSISSAQPTPGYFTAPSADLPGGIKKKSSTAYPFDTGNNSYNQEPATLYQLPNGHTIVHSTTSNKWDIINKDGISLSVGKGQDDLDTALGFHKELDAAIGTEADTLPISSETPITSSQASLMSLFEPLKTNMFILSPGEGNSIVGVKGTGANELKMAFVFDPAKASGHVSWQPPGQKNAESENFTGTPGAFFNLVNQKHEEASGAGPPKAENFVAGMTTMPAELNGVAFASWTPPSTHDGWANVEGQNTHLQEPPMVNPLGKKVSCGVLIEEPDGRVWIFKPKGEYDNTKFTFPKGGQEAGHSMQATAIKECFEESGLKCEITGFAGDYLGSTTMTRYYHAKRTGGTPLDYGPEAEMVTLVPKEELGKYVNKPRDLQIAKDHFSPKVIGHPLQLHDLTKIAEKKGSNPGGVYQDPDGKKYYVKLTKSNLHTANELLAADLMAKAGGSTLKYHAVHDDGGKINVGTQWEELQKDNVSKLSLNERRQAQSDFAVNAWLANWDAAGTGGDNQGVLNGKTVTLDVGGALLYRAQGTPKGDAFGHAPTEWETMRKDTVKNPDSVKLYGDMTDEQLKESAAKLANITNKDIADSVHSHFAPDSNEAAELIDKLISRRDKITQYAAALYVAPKPTPTPVPKPTPVAAPVKHTAGVGTFIEGSSGYNKQYVTSPTEPNKSPTSVYHDLTADAPPQTGGVSSALSYYKGHGYNKINDCLRYAADCDHIDEVPKIRNWIHKAKRTSKPLTLFRGIGNKHSYSDTVKTQLGYAQSAGKPLVLKDDAFLSTTTSISTARSFGSSGMCFIIEVPVGTVGASVNNSTEEEFVMQQGTRLIVTGEKDKETGFYKARISQEHMVDT